MVPVYMPIPVIIRQNTTLAEIYPAQARISPFFNKSKASTEKVEKVVKPPQNPTESASLTAGGNPVFCAITAYIKPSRKLPVIFTESVASGSAQFWQRTVFPKVMFTRYLKIEPIPPPINTEMMFNIRQWYYINSIFSKTQNLTPPQDRTRMKKTLCFVTLSYIFLHDCMCLLK